MDWLAEDESGSGKGRRRLQEGAPLVGQGIVFKQDSFGGTQGALEAGQGYKQFLTVAAAVRLGSVGCLCGLCIMKVQGGSWSECVG